MLTLVLGVGLSSEADPEALRELAHAVLTDNGMSPDDVTVVATLRSKADSDAVVGLAGAFGAEVAGYPAATLASCAVPHPNPAVGRAVGTSSVAEAAVVAYGARLVVGKTVRARCSVAVGTHARRAAQPTEAL